MKYDALVIGAGIGGMESSLKLGDMGYKVLLVEKEASIGGRMILLSKVFPTLDCASCISGPKMSSTINHPNVTTMTYAEVESIRRDGDGHFHVAVHQKARYVDTEACTGCQECERACTVAVPDEFNYDLVGRRAAYIPFPQAVPKKAVITRAGTSPCSGTCPAGIKAHGYVSLTRSGKSEEAFRRVLDATPLVGTLGRACYAPCESECTRTKLEGAIPIRRIKRFVADRHYATHNGPGIDVAEPNGKRVAIVGSGPAGLTAAWQLARNGYGVKIFEAAPRPGGALRLSIPGYRLPIEVVERDIANVTAIGVEIETGTRITDLAALRADGFDAVVVATGTPKSAR
ncbi:MAG: NAD(P)-binding protein, partial [Gemmatimonadota bacterium]|nr:NAD(P)-binding protein [Gemmatimonadota bacterium]